MKLKFKKLSGRISAMTPPFFELQTPDFAWQFVWTVPTNYEFFFGQGRQKGGCSGASGGNSAIF